MTKIELSSYPGYFWDLEERVLYSNKLGGMKLLKLQKKRQFGKYGRLNTVPEHYQVSRNGSRLTLTVEQIYRLIANKYVQRVLDAVK